MYTYTNSIIDVLIRSKIEKISSTENIKSPKGSTGSDFNGSGYYHHLFTNLFIYLLPSTCNMPSGWLLPAKVEFTPLLR